MPDSDLPGYSQDRLRWQAPSVLSTAPAELARAVQAALQAIYRELVNLSSRRNVVALQGDTDAREGQVIAGVAAAQKIRLPSPNPGEFGEIAVLITAVKSPCTVVNLDASTFSLTTVGLYEFGIEPDGTAWRSLSTVGAAAGASLTTGNATLDFGAAPGTNVVSVAVADAGIVAGSSVWAWVQGNDSTGTHNAVEHQMLPLGPLSLTPISITPGVGFTLQAMTPLRVRGTFTARWARS